MSVLKPTRLQSKQVLATVLNYLNQSFWNCWKWAVFLWSFGWLWPAGEGEQSWGFDDGVCPVPISSPSPVVKTPTPSSFHPRPLLRVMVLSQLSHPPEGLPCSKGPCPGWAPGVPRGVHRTVASAWETLLVTSATPSPALPAGKPGASKGCSWAHMSLWQHEVLCAVVLGRQQI